MASESSITIKNSSLLLVGCFVFVTNGFLVQAKAMAGDHAVRSLLEKMTQSASSAYLGILERYLVWIIQLESLQWDAIGYWVVKLF